MRTAVFIFVVTIAWIACYGLTLWLDSHIADASTAFTLSFLLSVILAFATVYAGCQLLDLWEKKA